MTPHSVQLSIAGAGTMGSGIALTALRAGLSVTLFDPYLEALDRARTYLQDHLRRKSQLALLANLDLTQNHADLAGAGVIIEAIPEDLAQKLAIFARLDGICPPPAVLATNTRTLPVTAIAAAVSAPERVAGMHFFNPAPVLPLVEIVRGALTSPDVIEILVALAGQLGKTPVVVSDTPGFIVNRVARPYSGEALNLLGEGVASHQVIAHIARGGAGFRLGTFQLMDLIGIDVNFQPRNLCMSRLLANRATVPILSRRAWSCRKDWAAKPGKAFIIILPKISLQTPAPQHRPGIWVCLSLPRKLGSRTGGVAPAGWLHAFLAD